MQRNLKRKKKTWKKKMNEYNIDSAKGRRIWRKIFVYMGKKYEN